MSIAPSRRVAIWLAVAAGLLLVIGANAHLVYMAVLSQPAISSKSAANTMNPSILRLIFAKSSLH